MFAAGSAVKPIRRIVRAVAEGKAVAASIHQHLSGQTNRRRGRAFSSVMGRLERDEIQKIVMEGPGLSPRVMLSSASALTDQQAGQEAMRCLYCDCRKAANCELRHYAAVYEAQPNRFKGERRHFELQPQHADVIYEPGKCIACGICVQLAEQAGEPLGLSFVGRGFDARMGVPFNASMAEGLQRAADACVRACPTGALAFKENHKATCMGCPASPVKPVDAAAPVHRRP